MTASLLGVTCISYLYSVLHNFLVFGNLRLSNRNTPYRLRMVYGHI